MDHSTVIMQSSLVVHPKTWDKYGTISGPCPNCPPLTEEEGKDLKRVKSILRKVLENDEGNDGPNMGRLRKEFEENEHLINLHDSSKKGGCEKLLHMASDKSHLPSMQLLLESGASPNATNRWNQLPLHTVLDEGDGCHCPDCNDRNAECVKLLLKYGSHIDVKDWEGDTPLSCAALTLMDDCADALWNAGASIHTKGQRGRSTPGELVASYIPDNVSKWFDSAIKQNDKDKLHLELDFGAITGRIDSESELDKAHESQFLVHMANSHKAAREKLLLHPLTQAYLHIKWEAVTPIFLLLRLSYLFMAIIYSCYIITFFHYKCPFEEAVPEDEPTAENDNAVHRKPTAKDCEVSAFIYTMSAFLIVFLVCMVLNEIYEVNQGFAKYIRTPLNYGWWLMITTVTLNLIPVYADVHGHWQYPIAAFGIFLAWGMFMVQLARDPKIGIYVEMLGSILVEFLLFSVTYISLVVGFTLGFSILFPDNPMFEFVYGFLPFVKILLMMLGEADYEGLFDEEENPRVDNLEYSIGAHIMFVGFIVVVTIVLTNLLIGLTISDVQELRMKAELSKTERLVQQIDLTEKLFRKHWMPQYLKDLYINKCSIEKCVEHLNREISHVESFDDDESSDEEVFPDEGDVADNQSEYEEGSISIKEEVEKDYKRSEGPVLRGFEPLRRNDTTVSQELKEKFIRFVDKDDCSKKGKQEKQKGFCSDCQLLLSNIKFN